jgi:hypothetical protein
VTGVAAACRTNTAASQEEIVKMVILDSWHSQRVGEKEAKESTMTRSKHKNKGTTME